MYLTCRWLTIQWTTDRQKSGCQWVPGCFRKHLKSSTGTKQARCGPQDGRLFPFREVDYLVKWQGFYGRNRRVTVIKTLPAAQPPTYLPQRDGRGSNPNIHVKYQIQYQNTGPPEYRTYRTCSLAGQSEAVSVTASGRSTGDPGDYA